MARYERDGFTLLIEAFSRKRAWRYLLKQILTQSPLRTISCTNGKGTRSMAEFSEAAADPQHDDPDASFGSHVSYSELRQNLKKHLDYVTASRAPLLISRGRNEPVVMLALSEYESMQETLHLLRSPANAERLLASIAQANSGDFVEANIEE